MMQMYIVGETVGCLEQWCTYQRKSDKRCLLCCYHSLQFICSTGMGPRSWPCNKLSQVGGYCWYWYQFHINMLFVLNVSKLMLKKDSDGLVQDCGNSSALAMEIPQSCAELSHQRIFAFTRPSENEVYIGSGNGLLSDGTRPLPKSMLSSKMVIIASEFGAWNYSLNLRLCRCLTCWRISWWVYGSNHWMYIYIMPDYVKMYIINLRSLLYIHFHLLRLPAHAILSKWDYSFTLLKNIKLKIKKFV